MLKKRKRQLAAIMFTDIIGYSAMMNTNEQDGITKANRYRQVLTEQVEKHGGEIIQHYGDGSLSIFSSSVEAVTCAKRIQTDLKDIPQVPLRVGLHLGDIVLEGEEIYGDGVNIASRVESMGIAGAILMTERIVHDLKSHPDFILRSLGSFQFKNIAKPLEVFALANEGFPIPDKNTISGKLAPTQPNTQKKSNKSASYLWGTIIGIIVLIAGWNHFYNIPEKTPAKVKERISIAVLPIENLSASAENASICNGLQEIIARISAVKDFRVIPRTSVLQVANNNLSIPEIAKELGVTYIIEGSLQSSNDQISINANLIETSKNEVIWNQGFKGDYMQIFDFQTAIAQSVSKQLGATLTPVQTDIVTRRPTTNRLAYQEYLKGLEEQNLYSEKGDKNYLENAKIHFLESIKIDKNYEEAYVKLAEIHLWIAGLTGNPPDSAVYYADWAIAINPNLANAYHVKGEASRFMGLDIAEKEFLKGYELNPSSSEINRGLSNYYLYKNQYDKAFRYAQEALLLSPREGIYYSRLSQIYSRCEMEQETYAILSRGIGKTNDNTILTRLGWADVTFKNDPTKIIERFSESIEEGKSHPLFKKQLARMYCRTGQYEKVKALLEPYFVSDQPSTNRNEFFRIIYAYALRKTGNQKASEKYVEDVLNRRTKFLQPESSYYHYNFQAIAAAHAMRENADSTIYWLKEWKRYGNFGLNLFKTDSLYIPIMNEPIVQEFIKNEQEKIDSMATNIRQMRIKG